MAEPFNEAAFRVAVDMWWNNPDRATTHRILTGARHVLGLLDEARTDRDGFVEEIRDLNDQLEQARAKAEDAQTDRRTAEMQRDDYRAAHKDAVARAEQLAQLVRDLTDPDPCYFDHHGGCQAHGYLSLRPGEKCPHAEAKELLGSNETEAAR